MMECPTCRAPYQPGDRFCGSCGERLGDAASAAAPRPANPWESPSAPAGQPAPSLPSMPQFEGGGATIAAPSGAAFGQGPYGPPPTPPAMPQGGAQPGAGTCPTCSAPVEPTDTTCLVCGAALRPGAAAAPPGGTPFGSPPPAGTPFNPPTTPSGPFGGQPDAFSSPFAQASGPGAPPGPGSSTGGGPFGSAPPSPAGPPFPPAGEPAPSPYAGQPSSPFAASGEPVGGPGPISPPSPPYGTPRPSFPPPPEPVETRAGSSVCPIHGVMKDPSWTRCPDCIREGRDGRLISAASAGTIDMSSTPPPVSLPPTPPAPSFGKAPEPPSFSSAPPGPPPPAFTPAPPVAPAAGNTSTDEGRPISSVGQTFVIRRKPRSLAFLIEKEGEQVGRVFQLERDVTDMGRDPRNHIVVSDVLVSGFHVRVERVGDGGFTVTDRGSTNGTRVNGEPLIGSRPLVENDELGVGNTTLVLKVVQ